MHKILEEVEKIVQAAKEEVIMVKRPLTPRAKMVLEYAIEESRNLNHNYVGTQHMLLGLTREEGGLSGQVLFNLGLKGSDVRAEVVRLTGEGHRS